MIEKAIVAAIEPVIDELLALQKKIESIPAGADGKDGIDGKDGKDGLDAPEVSPEEVAKSLITNESFLATLKGKDGVDGKDGKDGQDGKDGEDGQDGTSVYPDEVTSLLLQDDGFLEKVKGEKGADGDTFNLTGGFDPTRTYRKGDIYIKDKATFLVGEERHHMIVPRVVSEKEIREIVTKANGDLEASLIGLMTDYTKEATHGLEKRLDNLTAEVAKEFNFNTPTDEESVAIRIYRGDWRNGNYRAGDVVTTTQGLYIALVDTTEHPADGEAWELMLSKSTGSKGGSGGGGGLPTTGGTLTGDLNFAYGGGTGRIALVNDPIASGKILDIESDDGIAIRAPYLVLDSDSPIMTMPGAAVGSAVVVAGLNSAGDALLGYAPFPDSTYLEFDTADTTVVIKAAAAAVPSPWVELGLQVTLQEDIAAGTGVGSFVMMLLNPTTRTGTVEFGLDVNGVVSPRTLSQAVAANFNSHIAFSSPLPDAYATGDVIKLVARVKDNSNNAFALNMVASPLDPAEFRIAGNISGAVFVSQARRIDELQVALDAARFALGDLSHMAVHGSVATLLDDLEARMAVLEAAIPPTTEGTLTVDKYSGNFLRVRWVPADNPPLPLTDGSVHYIKLALATTDDAGGVHFATTAELRAMNAGATWFDNMGTLGKVVGSTGADITGNAIASYIDADRILTVTFDGTDSAHPKLVVSKVT
jgi:hypothetical protein